MTKTNLFVIAVTVCFLAPEVYAQTPGGASATTISLWMKAESALPAAGGNLTQWKDEKNVNTFSITGTPTTVKNVINFHPTVRFTGSQKLIGNTSINWTECIAVASFNGATNIERGTVISPTISGTAPNDASRYFFRSGVEGSTGYLYSGMGVDSIGFLYQNAPADDEFNVYTASGPNDVFNRNGVNAIAGTLYGGFTKRGTSMTSPPQIGDRSTNDAKLKGDIAEIIVFNAANAAGTRNKVESYLALKYGITLGSNASPVSYMGSVGNTYWTGSSTYQNNVFGVGNDAGSGLNQTQSNSANTGSGDGTGQSGEGNMVLSTISTTIAQQYLMIGNDVGGLTESQMTTANGPAIAATSWRFARNWKVQNTNNMGNVKLSFSLSGLSTKGGNTYTNYWLMIDVDGNGNYTNGTIKFIQASSITAGSVVFNSINLPNNAVFTIITKASSNVVLSLDWQEFNATAQKDGAQLQWSVGNEGNIALFDIERSTDGVHFTRAASQQADANGDVHTYQESLTAGEYYYRIKAVDRDGNVTYSPIRSIAISSLDNLLMRLRSNPVVGGRLQLNIWSAEKNTAMICIVDREGRSLFQRQYALHETGSLLTIDVGQLPAGLYFIQAQAGQRRATLSFIK